MSPSTDDVTLSVIEQWDQLDAVRDAWDQLAAEVPSSTFFQTAMASLSLAVRDDPEFHPTVVVAHDARGLLAGVLPLGIRRSPDRGRTLVPLTEWHASTFDAISRTPAITEILWQRGKRLIAGWDNVDLRFVPDNAVLRTVEAERWHADESGTRLPLDAAVLDQTPPKFATEMRRLGRRGALSFSPTTEAAELPAVLDRFVELHSARWEAHGAAAEYATPSGRERLSRVLLAATDGGVARVGTLRLDDTILAIHLAFRWHQVQYTWRIANATGWKAYSIGMMLYDLMFRAAATEGCTAADLGRGTEAYKDRWHPVRRPLWRYRAHGPTLRGRLGHAKTVLIDRFRGTSP